MTPAGQFQMGTLPLDLEKLLEEGEISTNERPWTGLDAGTRVGHVHLQVADLAAAVRFYTEGLGFETMVHYAGDGRGVRLCWRLPSPHRLEHLDQPWRAAATCRRRRAAHLRDRHSRWQDA